MYTVLSREGIPSFPISSSGKVVFVTPDPTEKSSLAPPSSQGPDSPTLAPCGPSRGSPHASPKCNFVACGLSSPRGSSVTSRLSEMPQLACLAGTLCSLCPPTPQAMGPSREGARGPSTQWGFKKTDSMTKSVREGLWSQSILETESTVPCVTWGKFLSLSVPVSSSVKGERNSNLTVVGGNK